MAHTRRLVATLALVLVVGTSCGDDQQGAARPTGPCGFAVESSEAAAAPTAEQPRTPVPGIEHVVAVSLDGLSPAALEELGRSGAPNLWRLIDEGASTLNARTVVERTITLPNHTSMLTGDRVDADQGGHGVEENECLPGTVSDYAGHDVASVFDPLHEVGLTSSLYASKDKFDLFERSWATIDTFRYVEDDDALVDLVVKELDTDAPSFAFVHLSGPDEVGHEEGWMGAEYLEAVQHTDALVGELLDEVESDRGLRTSTVVIVTADHGGPDGETEHDEPDDPQNYTIPFLVVGPRVPAGADLYSLNPGRTDPGGEAPNYEAPGQPIRNGDLANLVASLLGAQPVEGSVFGADRPLRVQAR